MQPRIITQISALLICLGSVAALKADTRVHGPEAEAAGLDVEVLKSLDAAMQKQVDDKHVSGVIGIIARHGTIGYYETFGRRVIEKDTPMTKETLFRIYSMTKPIVAVTAMSLWEEGKFKLDDPIAAHLPEWKDATARSVDGPVPVASPITPRHLLTHSSGLTYNIEGMELADDATLQEFSEAIVKRPLKFQPGTGYAYGYSIDILGRYIEAIEGKPLDVVMRERVFDRLEMDDTEFWVRDAADRDRVAHVYRQPNEGELETCMLPDGVMVKPPRMMGGQGLMSTARDYARFCQMFLNKGRLHDARVLKKKTVELMCENHLHEIGGVYGLGGMVDGKGGYTWGGAAGTKFWIDSQNDCYGVMMIQKWKYKAPTEKVFHELADKAIQGER